MDHLSIRSRRCQVRTRSSLPDLTLLRNRSTKFPSTETTIPSPAQPPADRSTLPAVTLAASSGRMTTLPSEVRPNLQDTATSIQQTSRRCRFTAEPCNETTVEAFRAQLPVWVQAVAAQQLATAAAGYSSPLLTTDLQDPET